MSAVSNLMTTSDLVYFRPTLGEAFYVGKPDKIGPDLVQFWYDVIARDVGEDGEVLARVWCDIDKHFIYRKIKNPGSTREEWWWYNPNAPSLYSRAYRARGLRR